MNDIVEFLTIRGESGINKNNKLIYLKKDQLFRYVNNFVMTSPSSLVIPLRKDHCVVTKGSTNDNFEAALDLKIQKQSEIVDDLIKTVKSKSIRPILTKVKVDIEKGGDFIKDVDANIVSESKN